MPFWGGRRKTDIRFLILVSVAILLTLVWMVSLFRRFEVEKIFEVFELKAYDTRMSLQLDQEHHKPSKDIAIVAFDDPSLYTFEDKFGAWPWPRTVHADMIKFMNKAGVKLIAYDIMFLSNRLGDKKADLKLVETIKANPNVFIGMNFDHYNIHNIKLAIKAKPKDPQILEPYTIPLTYHLTKNRYVSKTGPDGFYENANMTFSNYRPLMQELYSIQPHQIYIINHARDEDGVSRSNPLVFRFIEKYPKKSKALPYTRDALTNSWYDANKALINKDGFFLETNGSLKRFAEEHFFPHMSIRLLEYLKQKEAKAKKLTMEPWQYALDEKGRLRFPGYSIPLSDDGTFFVNWYTNNVQLEKLHEYYATVLEPSARKVHEALQRQPDNPQLQQQAKRFAEEMETFAKIKQKTFPAQPYDIIPAWRIIQADLHQRAGKLTAEDKAVIAQLKDRIIFVGSTSVSNFDIKTTPVSRVMPGVIQQAVIFDNIYQNKDYIQRMPRWFNYIIATLLCAASAISIVSIRSVWLGMIAALGIIFSYLGLNVILFKQFYLWLDLALPMTAQFVTTLITYIVRYISRNRDYEKTYKLATTDGLTGLHNHRFFQEFMHSNIEKAKRMNGKFSLLLIDIDFFKKFNDTHGHQAGDEVLRRVAQKLQASVRSSDLVARYGGEEMAVVLTNTDEAMALQVAEKLVYQVGCEAYPIAEGVAKHVTISVGVATYPTHGISTTALIEFSDQGLYRAKHAGRNQVGAQFDTPELLAAQAVKESVQKAVGDKALPEVPEQPIPVKTPPPRAAALSSEPLPPVELTVGPASLPVPLEQPIVPAALDAVVPVPVAAIEQLIHPPVAPLHDPLLEDIPVPQASSSVPPSADDGKARISQRLASLTAPKPAGPVPLDGLDSLAPVKPSPAVPEAMPPVTTQPLVMPPGSAATLSHPQAAPRPLQKQAPSALAGKNYSPAAVRTPAAAGPANHTPSSAVPHQVAQQGGVVRHSQQQAASINQAAANNGAQMPRGVGQPLLQAPSQNGTAGAVRSPQHTNAPVQQPRPGQAGPQRPVPAVRPPQNPSL